MFSHDLGRNPTCFGSVSRISKCLKHLQRTRRRRCRCDDQEADRPTLPILRRATGALLDGIPRATGAVPAPGTNAPAQMRSVAARSTDGRGERIW
jgi:hypothetical protein